MTEQNGVGRSSATDILQRMLDERGVEWYDDSESIYWDGIDGTSWTAESRRAGDLYLCSIGCTPEQAIAATLGGGECHVKAAKKMGDSFGFSLSCGHSMVNPFNDRPDYCPWCGRKVVKR